MELRIYPEYIGNQLDFQIFLLSHFKVLHYVVENHAPHSPVHIHALLQGRIGKPINALTFKRYIRKYIKTKTQQKLRNNSLHVGDCDNEPCFIDYLRTTKQGGYKEYSKLRHPFCFDTNYYVNDI